MLSFLFGVVYIENIVFFSESNQNKDNAIWLPNQLHLEQFRIEEVSNLSITTLTLYAKVVSGTKSAVWSQLLTF